MSLRIDQHVLGWCGSARRVVVFTGAGMSAESGVPTFRDALSGLWATFKPEELATPQAFERDPARVAGWYDARRRQALTVRPNAGHQAVAQWQARLAASGGSVTVITQNVDGLHEHAGTTGVLHLHGSLFQWRCKRCGAEVELLDDAPLTTLPPACGRAGCDDVLRPGVVWFGETLPQATFAAAARAIESAELFVAVGTSGLVYPAAGLAEVATARSDCRSIEVNPEATPLSDAYEATIRSGAAVALPALAAGRA